MSYASATKYSEERNGSSGCPGSNMSFGTPANSQMPVRSGWLESRIEEIESIVAGTGKGGHSREELKQTRARIFRLEGALDKALSFGDANGCKESHLLALSDASFALYKAHGDGVSGDAAAELAFTEDRVVQQKAKEKLVCAFRRNKCLCPCLGTWNLPISFNFRRTLQRSTCRD